MVTYTVSQKNINPGALKRLYDKVDQIVKRKGGIVSVTQMLAMLAFPPAAARRIRAARGPVNAKFAGGKWMMTNTGKEIGEDPGNCPMQGIIIRKNFRAQFSLNRGKKMVVIDKIKGLIADGPGPLNFDVHKVTVQLPRKVIIEY